MSCDFSAAMDMMLILHKADYIGLSGFTPMGVATSQTLTTCSDDGSKLLRPSRSSRTVRSPNLPPSQNNPPNTTSCTQLGAHEKSRGVLPTAVDVDTPIRTPRLPYPSLCCSCPHAKLTSMTEMKTHKRLEKIQEWCVFLFSVLNALSQCPGLAMGMS